MKSFKIKEAFHSIRNGANIKQDKSSGGIPVTRIETISESTIDLEKLGYAGIIDDSFKNFYLQDGDILMSHINSVSHLGKVAIFENRSETIIHGMNLLCLKARTNILYPKYAYYFFRSPIFINSLKPITKKSVNQASFNISNFENIDILIPEKYADQVRIATVLSKVEALIKQRKESIDLLNEFLKSTFLKMFGDPVRNEMGWEEKKLSEIIKIGTGGTPSRQRESEFYNGNISWAKTTEVNGNYIYETEEKITDLAIRESNCKIYPTETILLAMYGQGKTRGNVGFLRIEAATNQACAAIPPSENINQIFLFELLKHSYSYLRSLARGGNQENLNLSIVGNIKIIMPEIKLQNTFELIVIKTEDLKIQYQTSLRELENLFASLSQRAFKGELDLEALQVLVPEEEYQSFTNDRTEPHHFERNIDLETITVKVKPHKFYGGGEPIVAGESLAILIKERYKDKYFSFEMLANFIKKKKAYDLDKYFSSEEIKANPKYDELEDLKVFLESAIVNVEMDVKQKEKRNPWLHLNQHFYNAKKENISLELTKEDFALIKNRTAEERSGIYFNIVPDEIN